MANDTPAFPSIEQWNEWSELKAEYVPKTGPRGGMTLRDWFAGQALVGVTSVLHQGIRPADIVSLARDCYGIADAMLAAREKQS